MTKLMFQLYVHHAISRAGTRPLLKLALTMVKRWTTKRESVDMENFATAMKAMAHKDRLAIIKLLCQSQTDGLSVKKIYETLKLQQPVVSRHLNILRNAGVVRRLQQGQKINYCLCINNKNIEPLIGCFC